MGRGPNEMSDEIRISEDKTSITLKLKHIFWIMGIVVTGLGGLTGYYESQLSKQEKDYTTQIVELKTKVNTLEDIKLHELYLIMYEIRGTVRILAGNTANTVVNETPTSTTPPALDVQ